MNYGKGENLYMNFEHLPWSHLLPIRAVVVTLRFLRAAQFHPYHQPAVTAFIRTLLNGSDSYENQLTLEACESGTRRARAGDRYRLILYSFGGATELLQRTLERLQRLPQSAVAVGKNAPLGDNVVLEELHCLWSGAAISEVAQLTPYDAAAWVAECQLWSQVPAIMVRYQAPVRLLKSSQQRQAEDLKGEARYCQQGSDLGESLLYQRLHDTLADLLRRCTEWHLVRPDQLLPPLTATRLEWVEAHYHDGAGHRHAMGGLIGEIELGAGESIPLPLLSQWVLVQYLGMGQRRAFGWGRFRLESVAGDSVAPVVDRLLPLPPPVTVTAPPPLQTAILEKSEGDEPMPPAPPAWQPEPPDPLAERGTVVVVSGAITELSSQQHHLKLSQEGETVRTLPWRQIQTILLLGAHTITTPALRRALDEGITVHFANTFGRYEGVATAQQPSSEGLALWALQWQRQSDTAAALTAARAVVSAKLYSQLELLRQLHPPVEGELLRSMRRLLDDLDLAASLESLNGYEGSGSRLLFETMAARIEPEWGFSHRNRHPPRDPVNSLLSLGYTLLYARTDSLLRALGLLPWIGFYHQPHGRHATLASDLMEPFRYLVDRTVLKSVTHHQLTPADFTVQPDGAYYLNPQPRRLFLQELSERLNQPVKGRGSAVAGTFEENMVEQIRHYIGWLRGEVAEFQPWRVR